MSVGHALIAYGLAAAILTITPGLDTALVLRTLAVEGRRAAIFAAAGVAFGCLFWGGAVAFGLGAVLMASPAAFTALRWAGAGYLLMFGLRTLWAPRAAFDLGRAGLPGSPGRALQRGLLTNLLNPKVGVFYLSFLPQFVPAGVPGTPFMVALALIHALMGLIWLSGLALAAHQASALFGRPAVVRRLDRISGAVFVAFGLKLAFSADH